MAAVFKANGNGTSNFECQEIWFIKFSAVSWGLVGPILYTVPQAWLAITLSTRPYLHCYASLKSSRQAAQSPGRCHGHGPAPFHWIGVVVKFWYQTASLSLSFSPFSDPGIPLNIS